MKGTIFIIAFLAVASTTLQAQEDISTDFGTGLLVDDEAFKNEVEMTAEFSNDGRRAGDLPRWFSLRPYTPYPKNQGSINSCVGWAMGYAAMTTQRAYERRITNRKEITDNAYSALYIYNQVKEGSCMSGAFVPKAAEFIKNSGDCKSADFDFPYTDCERQPQAIHVSQSQNHLIKDFVALFDKDTPAKTAVMRVKRSIAEGKPVVVGMNISESLKRLSPMDSRWTPSGMSSDKMLGGHALCVIGYNDSLGVFEIMNSWGPAWGDQGYFTVSYKTFTERAFQAVQLVLPELQLTESELAAIEKRKQAAAEKQQNALKTKQQAEMNLSNQIKTNPSGPAVIEAQALIHQAEVEQQQASIELMEANMATASLAGDFVLRIPLTDDYGTPLKENGAYLFEEIKPVWNGSFYQLEKKDWVEGDMFQVIAKHIKKDNYVYLFSLDGNNKAEIHWPRNQRFAEHLNGKEAAGKGEGALVAHSGAEIVIPGSDRVLTRENLLADHIVVLYSFQKIEDFQQRVLRMRDDANGEFNTRLQQAFGDVLIPTESVIYEKDVMRTRADKLDKGTAVAVVVKVENE
jgi:C1A family cysteine protease